MNTLLEIPCDGRRTGTSAVRATWSCVSAPAPQGRATGQAAIAAATAAVVARLTGAESVPCELTCPDGAAFCEVRVPKDATLALLVDQAESAVRTGTPPVRGHQLRIGHGPAPEPTEHSEWLVGLRGNTVELAAPAALYQERSVARLVVAIADALPTHESDSTAVADVPVLAETERTALVDGLNDTAAAVPPDDVYTLVSRRAAEKPGDTAVVWSGGSASFAELSRWVELLASDLHADGVRRGDPLHLLLPRGPELLLGWLAALRIGAVCVPIDPGYPDERIAVLSSTTRPAAVLIREDTAHRADSGAPVRAVDVGALRERAPRHGPDVLPRPDDLAYVMHTSGSTGAPKGVTIRQRSLANLLHHTASEFGLRPGRRCLQLASPGFDVSVWEMLAPLYAGATTVLLDRTNWGPTALAEFIRDHDVDMVFLLATTLVRLDPERFPSVRTVITGGESFDRTLVDRWQPGRDLIYVYGPTEATVFQSWHRCYAGAPEDPPTVGRPMPNLRYYVLDSFGRPVPPGAVGHLHIGGVGTGRGYVGDEEATAAAFVPDPFGPPGSTLYRSGDLASFRPDGRLDFRGRIDIQVKIRGHRIEPGEVEAVLAAMPGVTAAAVVPVQVPAGERLLVAYVSGSEVDTERIGAALPEELPYYMVPVAVVALDALPYTPNGKIDRRNLTARGLPATPGGRDGDGERARIDVIRSTMAELLDRPEVSDTDGFFAVGGHSLAAAELGARLTTAFGVDVRVRDVFECSTPVDLAERVSSRLPSVDHAPDPAPAERTLPAQRWLWLDQQRRPGDEARYNVPALLRWSGPADEKALGDALDAVQRRHDALRTTLSERRGELELRLDSPRAALEVVAVTLEELDAQVTPRANRPFDLAAGPPLRVTLFRVADADPVLLVVAHHTVCDGRALETLVHDLVSLYTAERRGLPAPEASITGHDAVAALANARQDPAVLDREWHYWRTILDAPSAPASLPMDHEPTGPPGRRTSAISALVDPDALVRLEALEAEENTSRFAALCAVVSLTVHLLTGEHGTRIGTALDLRPGWGLGGEVGCLVNTVVLRVPVDAHGDFRTLLRASAREVIDAVDHGAYPFDRLVERLAPPVVPWRNPYFDVWVTLYDEIDVRTPEVRVVGGPVPPEAGLADFSFQFRVGADTRVTLQYDADRYEPATARDLLDRFGAVLGKVIAEPDRPVLELDDHREAELAVPGFSFAGFRFDDIDSSRPER